MGGGARDPAFSACPAAGPRLPATRSGIATRPRSRSAATFTTTSRSSHLGEPRDGTQAERAGSWRSATSPARACRPRSSWPASARKCATWSAPGWRRQRSWRRSTAVSATARCGGRFVTMALVAIDPESHVLTVVKAGHPDPLVRRASGKIEPVGRAGAGPPLGVTPRSIYKPVAVDARAGRPGCPLYRRSHRVDGPRPRSRLGRERLIQVAAEAPQGARRPARPILAAVQDHATGRSQYDDITIVCLDARVWLKRLSHVFAARR